MIKVRVYEVAREVGLPNRELVQKIASLGIQVRNHMSALDPSDVDRVKRAIEKEKAQNTVEERIRPTVVRRRTVTREKPVARPAEARPTNGSDGTGTGAHATRPTSVPPPATVDTYMEPELPNEPAMPVSTGHASVPPSPPLAASAAARPSQSESPMASERADSSSVYPSQYPSQPPPRRSEYDPGQDDGGTGEPAPAAVRFAHANLPLGVVARGGARAPGAAPLSDSARTRIVTEHAARRPDAPRRRELGRAALGPTGRPQGRPGRKKTAPGKKGKQTEITVPSAQKRVIRIEDQVQLQTLAQRMSLKATDVLMKLMQLGMSGVHINSTLDTDTAKILAGEFGYEVENVARSEEEIVGAARGEFEDREMDREGRPPIVTVMGHVDHGKTSLLDRIRQADVAGGEAGGITQHIGAYRVDTERGTVVFLDTPGHEAFTAMRARGAQATDIVILVVAADDGVMPQTREAIHHARAASVPIVVALNKVDKPDARPDQIKNELAGEGLQPEEWGGETIFVPVSAKTGQNVDKLLESVLLQAEVLELRANPAIPAEGIVLEAYLDRGRGPVANVLIRNGTLHAGDFVVAGGAWGRVRAVTDDRGRQVRQALPSTPVEILGLSEMPSAGDLLYAVTDPKKAQEVADAKKLTSVKPASLRPGRSLEQLYQMMQSGETQELKLVIKADVQGSVEAIEKALTDLSTDKVKVNVIHSGVGGITENDVMLASASNAIIVGFSVRPAGQAANVAKSEKVDVRVYNIIYEAVDEVKKAMAGLLAPTLVERELGKAEVRQVFTVSKIGTVAGCYVVDGKIARSGRARLVRDSVQVWEGQIASLRRFKDDVRDVASGYECGISLQGFNDLKANDIIECYDVEEVAATL